MINVSAKDKGLGKEPPSMGLLTSVGITLDAFFVELTQVWRESGIKVFPAAGSVSGLPGASVIPGLTREPKFSSLQAAINLRSWVQSTKPNVVVTNTATASALIRAVPTRTPIVYFCHGLHWNNENLRNLPTRLLEQLLLTRTAGVIVLNEDDEIWFRKHARQLPIHRLKYGVGVDTSRYVRSDIVYGEVPQLLWVGEFTERKDPEAALDIATVLSRLGFEFHLTMLGDGELLDAARRRVAESGLASHVTLPGRADVVPYLQSSSAVMHTAHWEGLPRALLEAVAVGRPVYSFDVKGARDIPSVRLIGHRDVRAYAHTLAGDLSTGAVHRGASLPDPESMSYRRSALEIAEFSMSLC